MSLGGDLSLRGGGGLSPGEAEKDADGPTSETKRNRGSKRIVDFAAYMYCVSLRGRVHESTGNLRQLRLIDYDCDFDDGNGLIWETDRRACTRRRVGWLDVGRRHGIYLSGSREARSSWYQHNFSSCPTIVLIRILREIVACTARFFILNIFRVLQNELIFGILPLNTRQR